MQQKVPREPLDVRPTSLSCNALLTFVACVLLNYILYYVLCCTFSLYCETHSAHRTAYPQIIIMYMMNAGSVYVVMHSVVRMLEILMDSDPMPTDMLWRRSERIDHPSYTTDNGNSQPANSFRRLHRKYHVCSWWMWCRVLRVVCCCEETHCALCIACDVRSVLSLHHLQYILYTCMKKYSRCTRSYTHVQCMPMFLAPARPCHSWNVLNGLCSGMVCCYILTQRPATPHTCP